MKYCETNPDTCKNGAKCISLTTDEGSYRCLCREGTSGQNCEYSEIHTVKPITAKPPALIPITSEFISTNGSTDKPLANNTTEVSILVITSITPSETTSQKIEPHISDNET